MSKLEEAIQVLVHRHESLRTHFEETDGEPFQVVQSSAEIPLCLENLNAEDARGDEAIQATLRQQAREAFELGEGPLLRVRLLRVGPSDHILHFVWHHIATDGWSLGVFRRELSEVYNALREDRRALLPELAIQYADYALWQREHLRGQTLQRLLSYWRSQLEGSQPLELPLDRRRPAVQRHRAASLSVTFAEEVSEGLRHLSCRENSTVFICLLAALKVMLFRYTGQEDISVGLPIANRGHAEVENLIGCLLNTLVVRTRPSSKTPFREFLQRVREVALEAYAHQELPFEKLLEELQPERNLNRTPLFQVSVNFTNSKEDNTLRLHGLNVEGLGFTEVEARFDLNFYFADIGKQLRLDLVYNSDLFEASTIERMVDRFKILIEAIVANPDQKLGALALLTPDEKKATTLRTNRARPANPNVYFAAGEIEQSIASRFEEQARKYPTRIAVKTDAHEWSYAELDRRANVIAREVLRLSPREGQRVALLLDHDAPMVGAILGCLKAGKIYVPLMPSHPRAQIARVISDAEPALLVTDAVNKQRAKEFADGAVQLVDIDALHDLPDSGIPDAHVSPDALAYLLYTSGSTGEPKGVAQSHRNVLHHIRNYTNSLHISPSDRVLLLASYGFDAAVIDIFGALLNGATLLPFDLRKQDFISLGSWIATRHVTIYHSTPSVFRHFLRTIPDSDIVKEVRRVVLGGEPVVAQDLELFRERFSSECTLVNGFGQTEYSFSLQYFADAQTEVVGNSVPIGYPVDDTTVELLDAEGHPDQVFGEIAIGSRYLFQEYWRRPELSAAAFQNDSHAADLRAYRTGDLGRLRPDGSIEFAGRKDFRVKMRGNRVELGEIETVLHRHSQIQSAVVVSRHSEEGEVELACLRRLGKTTLLRHRLVSYEISLRRVYQTT